MQNDFSQRRITDALLEHWKEIKGKRLFPSEKDLNLEKIEDIWSSCFLVQTRDIEQGEDYNYTYLGNCIIDAYGKDLTHQSPFLLASTQANHLQHVYERIIDNKGPAIDEGIFLNLKGQTVKYRQCLVPLGDNDAKVDSILGGMRYKIFE